MSLDKSLRSRGALVRHRNVLSRAERIEMLKDAGKWTEDSDVFGLPKIAHRKVATKKIKVAVAAVEGVPGAEGAAAPAAEGAAPAKAAAPGAKGAPAAKAATPAAKAASAKPAAKGKG